MPNFISDRKYIQNVPTVFPFYWKKILQSFQTFKVFKNDRKLLIIPDILVCSSNLISFSSRIFSWISPLNHLKARLPSSSLPRGELIYTGCPTSN